MPKYPILILHGWNLSASKFDPLVAALNSKGYQTQAIDLPGFGKSLPPTSPLTLDDYVGYVKRYIQKKGWKKVVIIGHSFGGRISIKLAKDNPSFLKLLILTGAPGYNPVPKFKILFFLTLAKIGNTILAIPIFNNIRELSRHLLYKMAKATDFYNTNKHMRETFKNIVNEDISVYLPYVKVPTLLLWGKNDLIVPLHIAQKMKKVMPSAEIKTISDARHGAPWTHPLLFSDEVISFIKNHG